MTDNTTEGVLAEIQQRLHDKEAHVSRIRRNLEQGWNDMLESGMDLDDLQQVSSLLELATGWQFATVRQYRVRIEGYVLVEARNDDEAQEMVERSGWSFQDGEIETDGFEVEGVELNR